MHNLPKILRPVETHLFFYLALYNVCLCCTLSMFYCTPFMFYCTPFMFYCNPSMCLLQDKVQEEESSKLKETYKTVPLLCFFRTPSMCLLQDKVQEEESSKLKETYKTVPLLCFTKPHLCVYCSTKFKKKRVPN